MEWGSSYKEKPLRKPSGKVNEKQSLLRRQNNGSLRFRNTWLMWDKICSFSLFEI